MFVLSHLFGPLLGLGLCGFLLLLGFPLDYRLIGFAVLVALFWVYPAALTATGRYRLLSLGSLQHLQLTILWASHGYGGLMSPFLLWMAVVPLLAFLYLSPSNRLWFGLMVAIAINAGAYILAETLLPAAPPVDAAALQWLALLSLISASAYVALMAVNFSRVLSSRSAMEREVEDHATTVALLSDRLSKLRHAGDVQADRLLKLSDNAKTSLAEMEASCRLLLESEMREGRGDDATELRSIGEAARYLAEVVEGVARHVMPRPAPTSV